MSEGWEAEVGVRSLKEGEGEQFTRFTIYNVVDAFWEKELQVQDPIPRALLLADWLNVSASGGA